MSGEGQGRVSPPQRLTQEEARVMRECNQESFYRRSLPISCAMMAGTLYMIRTGRWSPSRTLGPAPKVAAAGVVGYFIGKISYVGACKEKLMALPNSPVGRLLRQQRQRGGPEPGFLEQLESAGEEEVGGHSLLQEDQRPSTPAGLDDFFRPTVDSPQTPSVLSTEDLPAAAGRTTYQQLRQENRANFEARLRRGGAPPQPAGPAQQPSPPTNQYGDLLER